MNEEMKKRIAYRIELVDQQPFIANGNRPPGRKSDEVYGFVEPGVTIKIGDRVYTKITGDKLHFETEEKVPTFLDRAEFEIKTHVKSNLVSPGIKPLMESLAESFVKSDLSDLYDEKLITEMECFEHKHVVYTAGPFSKELKNLPADALAVIKAWRNGIGLTQDKVAAELGITKIHYSNIERGRRGLTSEMLVKLINILGLKIIVVNE